MRSEHSDAEFLIYPECGWTTNNVESAAVGDVEAEGVCMLSTGGMLEHAAHANARTAAISRPRS